MILQETSNIPTNITNRLSVQVTLTGLSFLVTNPNDDVAVFFSEKKFNQDYSPEDILLEIKTMLLQTEALQGDFKKVTVIYATNLYTVVPTPLFDETKASEYLKFNSKIMTNDFVAHDALGHYNITTVYIPYININNYLFDRFGSFQYYHATTILLKSILYIEKHSLDNKVYLHVINNMFDFIAIKKGALLQCNTYLFKTPEDFIYYILFSLEQLKLNPDSIEFILCGSIDKEDENYKKLYTYIRNISFFKVDQPQIKFKDTESSHHNFLLKNA